jgi:hypothetical protein
MTDAVEALKKVYERFNARDIEAVLAAMHDDVIWAKTIVDVHQVVRNLNGNLLADRMVTHIFRVEGELIRRFDIGE